MSETTGSSTQAGVLTAWDRRVVRAIQVSESARAGVIVLRIAAAIVVLSSVVGTWLVLYGADDTGDEVIQSSLTGRIKIGQLLTTIASPLAFAAVVFGLSFVLSVYASRLDLDIVLADEQVASLPSPDETTTA